MKKVLTNNIVQNVRKQRLPRTSLDHITNSIAEASKAMLGAIKADPAKVTIISGAEVTQNGQAYTLTAGWAAYQDEIFEVDAAAFNAAVGEVGVWQIAESFIPEDPVLFDDGQEFNVNQIRKIQLISGVSESGLADWDEAVSFHEWKELSLSVGATGQLLYKRNLDKTVTLRSVNLDVSGVANPFDGIATLPDFIQPLSTLQWIPITARYSGQIFDYKLNIGVSNISIANSLMSEPGSNAPDGAVYINPLTFPI